MSWHFSQALVVAYSAGNSLDGEQFTPLNGNPMPLAYLCSDRMTAFSKRSLSGMTFAPLTADLGRELLTWFLAAFPAKTSATQVSVKASAEKEAVCGEKWQGSFARFDPATLSLKMSQLSLIEDFKPSSETWPRWGWMRNGACFHLAPAVQHTHGKECSFWRTPTRDDAANRAMAVNNRGEPKLSAQFRLRTGKTMPPSFAEWIMRWVPGWTDLKPLEMDRMQQWLCLHGKH